MKHDITKPVTPTMPTLGRGSECFKLLLLLTSCDITSRNFFLKTTYIPTFCMFTS